MKKNICNRVLGKVSFIFLVALLFSCDRNQTERKEFREAKGEGEEMENKRKQYFEWMHRADPTTDWKLLEMNNRKKILADKQLMIQNGINSVSESFANGKITATWYEVGSNNIAGNIQGVDYFSSTDQLYCISDGGALWRSPRTSPNWTILNQQFKFSPRIINVVPKNGGGTKILTAADRNIYYSDNEGASFTASSGISFPIEWGGNYIAEIITLNDAQKTVYCLTRPWDPTPFAPRFWLYRSVDTAKTFTRIKVFDAVDDNRVSIWSPQGSDKLFAIETQNTGGGFVKLHTVSGSVVTVLNTSADVPVNYDSYLQGYYNGTTTLFYLLINNTSSNSRAVYKSANNGLNWTLQGSLTEGYYGGFTVSLNDPDKIFMGGVDLFRSFNAGVNWTRVNGWAEYYSNLDKLHADIMRIKFFKTTADQEFAVINTHGGTYLSNDNIVTTTNISLLNHNTGQFYDVITHPTNAGQIFVGTQDQGYQRYLGANVPINSPVSFSQVISGDYGQLRLTENATRLWTEYPGGDISYYNDLVSNNYSSTWVMPGDNKPNFGWMLATANTSTPGENAIYIGGGNKDGGPGSYLVKLTASNTAPFTITPTQINYNFRINSANGTSGISAIATSTIDPTKIYVATEDGTFFYSDNNGISWTKSTFTGIPGGFWLYGASILPSKITTNTIWYAGSGYSNPGVFKSIDGGINFSPMNNGLPPTLVHEIVANTTETLLFAATEAGPYVYVVADNTWYSIYGSNTPVQDYFSVEYVPSTQTVRFGTYGRGIWDFNISSFTLPVNFESITASLLPGGSSTIIEWTVSDELNVLEYDLQRSADGVIYKTISKLPRASGAGRKKYSFIDKDLSNSLYYYRVAQVDLDGSKNVSKTVKVTLPLTTRYKIYPTILSGGTGIVLRSPQTGSVQFRLFDMSGKLLDTRSIEAGKIFYLNKQLATGLYNYQLMVGQKVVDNGKLIIQ